MAKYLGALWADARREGWRTVKDELPREFQVAIAAGMASGLVLLARGIATADVLLTGALVSFLTLLLLPLVVLAMRLLVAPFRVHKQQNLRIEGLEALLGARPFMEYREVGVRIRCTGDDAFVVFPKVFVYNPSPRKEELRIVGRLWQDRLGPTSGAFVPLESTKDLGLWSNRPGFTEEVTNSLGGTVTLAGGGAASGYVAVHVPRVYQKLLQRAPLPLRDDREVVIFELLLYCSEAISPVFQMLAPVVWKPPAIRIEDPAAPAGGPE